MKLQCGVLHRDGRSASGLDLATVLGQFNAWNAETAGEVVNGPLAMVYRGDCVTVEEKNEREPVRWGRKMLTWDGRLDNRNEMAARVGLRCTHDVSDADIVAKAYAALGEEIIGELIGEFALVAWCEEKGGLVFARSVCGSRTLYYVVDGKRVMWSTDLAHLVRTSGVDLVINERYVIEYLFGQPSVRHTPFKNVHVVPPGTLVRIESQGGPTVTPFWDWSLVRPVRYSRDEDYEEHFRTHMRNAVKVRLRTPGDFFSEMSGGFDSSSIVLVADELLRERGESETRLKTLSCVFEESESCDETRYIQAIERRRGIKSMYVYEAEQPGTFGFRDISFTGIPNPLHAFPGRYQRFGEIMREHGARLLLTGYGGDHLFWSHCDGSPVVADELRHGHLRAANRECRTWSRISGTPYLRMLKMAMVAVSDALEWRRADYADPKVPVWLGERYRGEMLDVVHEGVARKYESDIPSERAQRRMAEDLFATTAAGYFAECRDLFISHPYTHRPLVEFCAAIPLTQFVRNGETRSLMRRSLQDLLPLELLHRRGKQPLDEALGRAVQREWNEVGDLRKWRFCELGYADPAGLGEMLEKARLGFQMGEEPLLRVMTLERWLRSLESMRTEKEGGREKGARPETRGVALVG